MMFFCLFQCFEETEYETESKRNETFGNVIFSPNVIQETWTLLQEVPGGHEGGGCALPPRRAPYLVGPSELHRRTPSSYIYLRTPDRSNTEPKPNSTAATFCIHKIPSWVLLWSSAGGGIDHGGLLHQHHSLSDDV